MPEDAKVDSLKQELRAQMKALRSSLSAPERAEADAAIRAHVLELPAYRGAGTVFSYLSFGAEVDTRGIIEAAWRDGKTVALPRCTGPRQMRWFRVDGFAGLERNSFGVEEPRIVPACEVFPASCADAIALVPGLTFDREGYRLGYGGGFYDAALAVFSGASVGLCRRVQLSFAPLPRGQHDQPVDLVVTEAGLHQ